MKFASGITLLGGLLMSVATINHYQQDGHLDRFNLLLGIMLVALAIYYYLVHRNPS